MSQPLVEVDPINANALPSSQTSMRFIFNGLPVSELILIAPDEMTLREASDERRPRIEGQNKGMPCAGSLQPSAESEDVEREN